MPPGALKQNLLTWKDGRVGKDCVCDFTFSAPLSSLEWEIGLNVADYDDGLQEEKGFKKYQKVSAVAFRK